MNTSRKLQTLPEKPPGTEQQGTEQQGTQQSWAEAARSVPRWKRPIVWFVYTVVAAILVGAGTALGASLEGHLASVRIGCSPKVDIGAPLPDQYVPPKMTTQGSAQCIPRSRALWLIVQIGTKFYPQVELELKPNGTGTWEQRVAFGGPGERGQTFTLYAVGADAAASYRFGEYLQQWTAGQNPSALTEEAGTYPLVDVYASASVVRAPAGAAQVCNVGAG